MRETERGDNKVEILIISLRETVKCLPGEDDTADAPLLRVPESPAKDSLLHKVPVIKWIILARAAAVPDSLDNN